MRYYVFIIVAAFSGTFTKHSNAQLTTMPSSATSMPSMLPSCSPTTYPSMEPSKEISLGGKKGSKKSSKKSSKKTSSKSPKSASKGKGHIERCGVGKGKGGKGKGSSKSPKSSKGKGGKGKGYSFTPEPSPFPRTFSTKSPSATPNSLAPSLEVRKDELQSDWTARDGEEDALNMVVNGNFNVDNGSSGNNSGSEKVSGIFSNPCVTLLLSGVAFFAL